MAGKHTLQAMRTPSISIGLLLAILIPIGFLTDESGGGGTTPVATIAKRVEELRGLRYRSIPEPERVTPRQVTRDGLADLDRRYPAAARHVDEAFYERLGLLPRGTDLRDVSGSVFASQVAGYYDPATKELKVVTGTATANRVLDEMVIAHELDHALEDQAIGFDRERFERSDDVGYAYAALVEGTATEVMYAYVGRYFRSDYALGGLLGGSLTGTGTGDIPPFVVAGLLFPYTTGEQFVRALLDHAGGRWTLVDLAQRTRPPATTEQVMHPRKWIEAEPALPVRLPPAPRGWRRLTTGVFGEWQTGQLLGLSGHAWADPAAGWGGDRYALYRRGGEDRVVMRWRFDTPRDLQEFRTTLEDVPFAGTARITERRGRVTLVLSRA
jgi:hypothetical protein